MLRKSVIIATLFATGLAASGMARAADPIGSAILGAGAGALLGQALGGRDGALIGGALGAVAGAAAASAQRTSHRAYGYGDPTYGYPPGAVQVLPPVGHGLPVPGYRGVAPAPGAYYPGSGVARADWERARFEDQQRDRWHWEREQRERQLRQQRLAERRQWEREQWARQQWEQQQRGHDSNRRWQ